MSSFIANKISINVIMPHCFIPVALGELFDKYSILLIKRERITNIEKKTAVQLEIDYLSPIVNQYLLDYSLQKQIKQINEELWDIEEKIREKETLLQFDQEFIDLARRVYKTNDERCRIKNKINVVLHSDIKEMKSYV